MQFYLLPCVYYNFLQMEDCTMKKKIIVGIATLVVVVAIAVLIVFVFSNKSEKEALELSGIWKVAVNVSNGDVTIPKDEYMLFTDNEASDYRDGNAEPFVKSAYKITDDVLELPDISKSYHVVQHCDICISLYTNDKSYISLVKAESENILKSDFNSDIVIGKWNVTYRPTEKIIVNEYLTFDNGVLKDYRDNSEQPSIEATYEWNGSIIKVPDLSMEMQGAKVADNRIVLIDINEGHVWLITKAE